MEKFKSERNKIHAIIWINLENSTTALYNCVCPFIQRTGNQGHQESLEGKGTYSPV